MVIAFVTGLAEGIKILKRCVQSVFHRAHHDTLYTEVIQTKVRFLQMWVTAYLCS